MNVILFSCYEIMIVFRLTHVHEKNYKFESHGYSARTAREVRDCILGSTPVCSEVYRYFVCRLDDHNTRELQCFVCLCPLVF